MRTKILQLLVFLICSFPYYAMGQTYEVSGKVTSTDGEVIIGAAIREKGTSVGTVSDVDGNFRISVSPTSTLIVSYLGYETVEVALEGRKNVDVLLPEYSEVLGDVVVVGYGSMKKSDLTGAVVSANIKDFEKSTITNVAQMLRGTVPGLNVGLSTSAGETPSISIRGKNTISGNTSILIVLDGIIYNGDIQSINPADIASIDILKDASATAVYGAQAANGVMLITTKKGKPGDAKLDFNVSYSWQVPTNKLETMTRDEILAFDKEVLWEKAYTEASGYKSDNPDFVLKSYLTDNYMFDENGNIVSNDYNWWDEFTRTGTIVEAKFNVSGGNDHVSYLLSFGHTTQENMMLNDNFKRNSIRVNIDAQARKWWKIGVQAFGSFINKDGQETYLPYLVQMSPLAVPYEKDGSLKVNPMNDAKENPWFGSNVDDYDRQFNFFANIYNEFNIIDGLTLRINYGNNLRIGNHNYSSKYAQNRNGEAYKNNSTYYDYTLDAIANYNSTFADIHNLAATLVYGGVSRRYSYTSADSQMFDRLSLGYNSLELGSKQYTYSDAWKESMLYQMARINYGFDSRYLATVTVRRDGYSGFAENNKSAVFPSVALGWVVSNESFWSFQDVMNNLKLRVGYGISGNQTNRYASLAKVSSDIGYIFNNAGAIRQELSSLENKDLKWEKTKGLNFGLDFGFIDNKITGSIEAYKTTTNDLLFNVVIPDITGFTTISSNVGKIKNSGIEFNITSHNIRTSDFEWTTTFNISHNSNEIKSLTGLDSNGDGKEDDLVASSLFIGESLSAIWDYKVDGIWQVGDDIPEGFHPGNYKVVDVNNDGKIDANDRTIIGQTDPTVRMGMQNSLRFKDFTLSFFINSTLGNDESYLGQNSANVLPDAVGLRNNKFKENADLYWSPNNPDGIYACAQTNSKLGDDKVHRYESRNFMRLQDLTLSYNIPTDVIGKIGIKGASINFNAKNLLTVTGWHGWDPEPDMGGFVDGNDNGSVTRVSGSTYANRPVMKSFTLGLNIMF